MKIYTNWAFDADADMKSQSNGQTYQELESRYRIRHCHVSEKDSLELDDYDIVVANAGVGYYETHYIVLKNSTDIGRDELALICDEGNLCFGYSVDYASGTRRFTIYTD